MSPSGTTTSTTNVTKNNAIITLAQLGEHKDVQSLWVAVHGKGKFPDFAPSDLLCFIALS
jgi:hypothetical protein